MFNTYKFHGQMFPGDSNETPTEVACARAALIE